MMEKQIQQNLCENYILQVQQTLLTAHLVPGRFADALRQTAEFLSAETAFLWLSARKKGQKEWILAAKEHPFLENVEFGQRYPGIWKATEEAGGLLIMDADELTQRFLEEGRKLADKGITSLLLYPVEGLNGKPRFILGALNLKERREDLKPLKWVAPSFLMAMDHYDDYYAMGKLGKTDIMTGVLNRNSYHIALGALGGERTYALGCVYIDVNGLHEVNNYLGHYAGDEMLRTVARVLLKHFKRENVFRIGGDEFVVLCMDRELPELEKELQRVRTELNSSGYEISVGLQWDDGQIPVDDLVNMAEEKMRLDKKLFYESSGKDRRKSCMNRQLEELLQEKRDADLFLSILEPEFKGVYFVDLDSDRVRHIFIPQYFEQILTETEDSFSEAVLLYFRRYVKGEYEGNFKKVCNYQWLKTQLEERVAVNFVYQKTDDVWLRLNIVRLESENERKYRTLWTFAVLDIINA